MGQTLQPTYFAIPFNNINGHKLLIPSNYPKRKSKMR